MRFREDGKDYEIGPGQYHIQRQGSIQDGLRVSDSPKYMYIHFWSEWTEHDSMLPRSGTFDYAKLKPVMEDLHMLRHNAKALHFAQAGKFFEILGLLYQRKTSTTLADQIADYISCQFPQEITSDSLEQISQQCGFQTYSHFYNLFVRKNGQAPEPWRKAKRIQPNQYSHKKPPYIQVRRL